MTEPKEEGYVKESVEHVLDIVVAFCDGKKGQEELQEAFANYMQNSAEYREEKAIILVEKGRTLARKMRGGLYYYFMTFLLEAARSMDIYKEILRHILQDDELTKENRSFLQGQLGRFSFVNGDMRDSELADLSDDLYNQIYDGFWAELNQGYTYVPKAERKENFVIVVIAQCLNISHAPTKLLFDRCYILDEYMHKKVFIINTAEMLSSYQRVPCFNRMVGSYMEEYSEVNSLGYEGKVFEFFQCPQEMPQVPIIKEIMDVVQHLKPWFVLSIGNSLVADLCSNIVPVIQLPTVTVGGMSTKATFQIVGRKVNDDDRQWVQRRGLPEDYIVESRPVYSFKSQTHQYTRKQLGLPENRFVVLLVGYRLDEEIDEACIETIVRLAEKEIFIAFVGIFEKYDSLVEKYGQLKNQSVFLGLQEDTLAINECCDVYLNPKRVGGGTSGAEALYKGSPVVTFDFGDVGNVAGPDFHVADYDEMYEKIIRYAEDKEYYGEMSRKAKQRAEALADSKSEFVRVIEKIEKSDRFR